MPSGLWSASTLKAHLGSTRFMKVARILHEDERDLVVKIFVKPEKLEDEVVLEVFTSLNRSISCKSIKSRNNSYKKYTETF